MKKQEFVIPVLALALAAALGVYLVINAGRSDRMGQEGAEAELTATSTPEVSTSTSTDGTSAPRRGVYSYGPVTLALNQAAGFANGLSIRPLEIVEDSRCPKDVQCISAGTTRVSMRIRTDVGTASEATQVQTFTLGEARIIDSTTITLTEVAPARMAQGTIGASAYRLTFTVRQSTTSANPQPPCYVGGCSAQLCSDQPNQVSTCEYRAEYGCYKTARCERQANGKCGWTQTDTLRACLANPS